MTTRKRKRVVGNKIDVDVCAFVFDLILFNGESYMDKPLKERKEVLNREFKEIEDKLRFFEFFLSL